MSDAAISASAASFLFDGAYEALGVRVGERPIVGEDERSGENIRNLGNWLNS